MIFLAISRLIIEFTTYKSNLETPRADYRHVWMCSNCTWIELYHRRHGRQSSLICFVFSFSQMLGSLRKFFSFCPKVLTLEAMPQRLYQFLDQCFGTCPEPKKIWKIHKVQAHVTQTKRSHVRSYGWMHVPCDHGNVLRVSLPRAPRVFSVSLEPGDTS